MRRILAILLLCGVRAFALNPSVDISQYAHHAWKNSDGFAPGIIGAIAQTPDGYLWLGTEFGLLRFDGVRPVAWNPRAGEQLPSEHIRSLLVTRDSTLWIGTTKGLASWKSGALTRYAGLDGFDVGSLLEDAEGSVWIGAVGAPTGRLCAIRSGRMQCYGDDGRFGGSVTSLREYQGHLWVGAATGLWQWTPDAARIYPISDPLQYVRDMIEGDNGALWIATTRGLRQFVGGKAVSYPLPAGGEFIPARFLRDREGGLWIGTTGQGLLHLHQGKTDGFASPDGLSDDNVYRLFEDREGSIWAASGDGLDRFRDLAVPTVSVKQGLSVPAAGAVLAARDGSIWIGTTDGLYRWSHGQMTVYRQRGRQRSTREVIDPALPDNVPESLLQDARGRIWVSMARGLAYFENGRFVPAGAAPATMVHSIVEDGTGGIWIGDQEQGLLHLVDGKLVESIAWTKLEHQDHASAMAAAPAPGGLWLGFAQGGIVYYRDGRVQGRYPSAHVNGLRFSRDGALWAATGDGFLWLKNGRIATLSHENGLPCDAVHWALEDDAESVWMGTPCGLLRISRSELAEWAADPKRAIRPAVFDASDGVQNRGGAGGFSPHAAKSADGRIWFATFRGVAVVDPRHIPFNNLKPPVAIEQITANGTAFPAAPGPVRLPKLIRNVQIDYTALSFVAPERNRFRYKLEGHDTEWTDADTRRQAFYTDLAPRQYRFRVQASNNSGVWNEAGTFVDFSVAPAWYQTTWFYAACVAVFLAMLCGFYRLRLLYLKGQFNLRLEERVGERTRVARDLHDTLLQSFQGVLLKFYSVSYMIPDRPEAQKALDSAIEEARRAIAEGRDAVQGLRSSTVITEDIARAITTLGEGLAGPKGNQAPEFLVRVEGAPRKLPPVVRDEIYRIAGEALRNSFRHSGARRIEVDIHYDKRQFQLRVRDNGKGIDRHVLDAGGRTGHHGMQGMQERASLVGGKLAIWSELDSGTEIELNIAAGIAYAKSGNQFLAADER